MKLLKLFIALAFVSFNTQAQDIKPKEVKQIMKQVAD